jgi:hypothetical protein
VAGAPSFSSTRRFSIKPNERMQKPLTVANWNHLEDALAGT